MATLTISPPFKVPLSPTLGGTGVANASGNTISFTGGSLSIADGASVFSLTGGTSASVLTIVAGKTLRANNTLTLAGTDATTMTFPATSTTVAGLSIAQTFTKSNTMTDGLTLNDTGADFTTSTNGILAITSTLITTGSLQVTSSSTITGGQMLHLKQTTSTYTNVPLFIDMASGSGTFTGNYIQCNLNAVTKFAVAANGSFSSSGTNFSVDAGGIITSNAVFNPGAITAVALLGRLPTPASGGATSEIWFNFKEGGTNYYIPGWS